MSAIQAVDHTYLKMDFVDRNVKGEIGESGGCVNALVNRIRPPQANKHKIRNISFSFGQGAQFACVGPAGEPDAIYQ